MDGTDRRLKPITLAADDDSTVYGVMRAEKADTDPIQVCTGAAKKLDVSGALEPSKSTWDDQWVNTVKCAFNSPKMFKEPIKNKRTAKKAEEENEAMLDYFKSTFDADKNDPRGAFDDLAEVYCFSDDDKAVGGCVNYFEAPFKGGIRSDRCIRMGRKSSTGTWCSKWFSEMGKRNPGRRDALIKAHCAKEANLYAPECACLNAKKVDPQYDAIIRELSADKEAPAVCWYGPCSQPNDLVFLTSDDLKTKENCPSVCKNVIKAAKDAGLSDTQISQEIDCNPDSGDNDELAKLKAYLLGAAGIVVFLFILVIAFSFTSGSSRRTRRV